MCYDVVAANAPTRAANGVPLCNPAYAL